MYHRSSNNLLPKHWFAGSRQNDIHLLLSIRRYAQNTVDYRSQTNHKPSHLIRWLMHSESLAKMSAKNYKPSVSRKPE